MTSGVMKVQLPQTKLTGNATAQGLKSGSHASIKLSPKMEKGNIEDSFRNFKLDELSEDPITSDMNLSMTNQSLQYQILNGCQGVPECMYNSFK